MPVPPSSASIGRYAYYTTPSYTSYRSPSSTSYLGRTSSLDRSSYVGSLGTYRSSYSSSYGSSAYRYLSRPPRPTYSTSTDTYRSSRSLRVSPVRSSYSRITSDSKLSNENAIESRFTSSRYRDTSLSRDSGYGSRYTSRDHSVDLVNGNGVDTTSSYVSTYSWKDRDADRDGSSTKGSGQNAEGNRVKVSERIREFEGRGDVDDILSRYRVAASPTREGSRSYDLKADTEDTAGLSRRKAAVSPTRERRSRTPQAKRTSPEKTQLHGTKTEDNENLGERRKSVSDLCRKYDTNHNVCNGASRSDDDEGVASDASLSSGGSAAASPSVETTKIIVTSESPPRSSRHRHDSSSKAERNDSPATLKEPSIRGESPALSRLESSSENLRKSPSVTGRDTQTKSRFESPSRRPPSPSAQEREERSSLVNGIADKPKSLVDLDDSYTSLTGRSRFRRDRLRERIAARLASELEDEGGSPPSRRRSPTGGSGGSTDLIGSRGSFSENEGLVGLRNIGNTCFLNSITQCLSNIRYLLEYLVRDGYSSDINTTLSTMKGDLIRSFASLLSDMWRDGADNSRALNTGPFKAQIQKFAPAFSGYQQHDAQEFLRKLLEGLHEDVNRVTSKPKPITEDIDESLDDNQKAIESWKRYLRYDDSKIVDMFVGQLKSSLQCSVCDHRSVTFDPFWDLSLPIPNKSSQVRLSQCLDLFTKEEVLDGNERPTCSKCKERQRMTKSFSIQKFPKILVLHLKRFSPLERWRGKLTCAVEFPVGNLDLSKFASSPSASCVYSLIGVANHSGTTYSGHYTAYCRHPYSGAWHEYNDSRVSSISQSRVCSAEAYVLFYEHVSSASKL